ERTGLCPDLPDYGLPAGRSFARRQSCRWPGRVRPDRRAFPCAALVYQLGRAAFQKWDTGSKLLLLGDVNVVQPVGIRLVKADLVGFECNQLVIKIAG